MPVELAGGAHAGAEVDTEGPDAGDGIGDVGKGDAAGEEGGHFGTLYDLSAEVPVVDAAGAAQLADRGKGIAGIEQNGVDMLGSRESKVDRGLLANVDDLDDAHAGSFTAKCGVDVGRGRVVDELDSVHSRSTDMLDNGVRIDLARQEEGRDGRRNGGCDLRDEGIVDRARSAGHAGDEAEGIGALSDCQPRLFDGRDAAHF